MLTGLKLSVLVCKCVLQRPEHNAKGQPYGTELSKTRNASKSNIPTNRPQRVDEPVGIYLPKVNNRNTRARCEVCPKITIKTSERRHWRRSSVFIVMLELISHLALVFLLLNLNM